MGAPARFCAGTGMQVTRQNKPQGAGGGRAQLAEGSAAHFLCFESKSKQSTQQNRERQEPHGPELNSTHLDQLLFFGERLF